MGAAAKSALISEEEAAEVAGISPNTLHRFVEAGCLEVEAKKDSTVYFSRDQVVRLLGRRSGQSTPTEPENTDDSDKLAGDERYQNGAQPKPKTADRKSKLNRGEAKLADADKVSADKSEPDHSPDLASTIINEESEEQRVEQLLKVIQFQDKLISDREKEIVDLKEQRDWLRRRVEKLETQGDQDRLLLLSETHTMLELLRERNSRKSFMRTFLEFVGVVPQERQLAEPENDGKTYTISLPENKTER